MKFIKLTPRMHIGAVALGLDQLNDDRLTRLIESDGDMLLNGGVTEHVPLLNGDVDIFY